MPRELFPDKHDATRTVMLSLFFLVSDQVDDCATQCVIGSVELLRIPVFLSWNVVSRGSLNGCEI